jgi:hypothetical protein
MNHFDRINSNPVSNLNHSDVNFASSGMWLVGWLMNVLTQKNDHVCWGKRKHCAIFGSRISGKIEGTSELPIHVSTDHMKKKRSFSCMY